MKDWNRDPTTSGVSPTQMNDKTSWKLSVTVAVLFCFETTVVMLRMVSRRLQGTKRNWADFLIPAAWLMNVGLFICAILTIQNGAGRHIFVVPTDQIIRFLIITHYPEAILYLFASTLPKLAILEIYIQVFVLEKVPRYICYVVGTVLVVNVAVNVPVILAQCQPISALWDPALQGQCNNVQQHFLWAAIPNITTDVVMMVLPLPVVWKLQASKRIKWGLLATFFVGSIGLVFSCVRFVGFNTPYVDGTFITPELTIAGIVEPGVYLLSACFITFRPLFRWIANNSFLTPLISRMSKKGSQFSNSLPTLEHIPTHHQDAHSDVQLVHQRSDSSSNGATFRADEASHKSSMTSLVREHTDRDDFDDVARHA